MSTSSASGERVTLRFQARSRAQKSHRLLCCTVSDAALKLCLVFGLVIAVAVGLAIPLGRHLGGRAFRGTGVERARDIQRVYPLVDGHNDLPMRYREMVETRVSEIDLNNYQPMLDTDIPRLREGEVGAQFWSVYVPCKAQYRDAVRQTLEEIDVVNRFTAQYPETFCAPSKTVADVRACFAGGRIASLMGMEGGHQIDSSLATIRMMAEMGVSYMTLTHNCNTPWADSCCDSAGYVHGGLTAFGRDVVKEMNRAGMLVDLSHTSPDTMRDALQVATAPVIFSHSNAYALCDSPRNVPDDVLDLLPANGGVVMVTFVPSFVTCDNTTTPTLADIVDIIDYISDRIGAAHVGIGSDFDGFAAAPPTGLADVAGFVNLTGALVDAGYSDDDVIGIIGGNVLRVMEAAEAEAARLQAATIPGETITQPFNDSCRLFMLDADDDDATALPRDRADLLDP